jgi:stage V sporulation protein D (sporulation-specific penicillin-binding protein)
LKIDSSGEGDIVVAQAPEPGVKLPVGSEIRLYMGDK